MVYDKDGNLKADIIVLKTYFGLHPGQTIVDFSNEIKRLTPADKAELVNGAAKELGWTEKP
jgi:hypothetical protein